MIMCDVRGFRVSFSVRAIDSKDYHFALTTTASALSSQLTPNVAANWPGTQDGSVSPNALNCQGKACTYYSFTEARL